jgi:DNA-binding transcriptional MerR regulator
MTNKSDQAYKTIGEVSEVLSFENKSGKKIATHTIRFWEKKFKQIKPKTFNGKRRYYDKETIDLLKKIKFLLKDKGMTINGVKKLLISGKSNELDEISNKSITANNLRNKLSNISKIIKNLKQLK